MDYDKIASHYDNGYEGYFFTKEDEEVSNIIGKQVGNILDVGCGTGLGIEIVKADKIHYLGIDISKKLIEIAKNKNPEFLFLNQSIIETIINTKIDLIIALYGVMNYLSNEEIEKIIDSSKDFFLMDYIDGYHPVCYPNNEYPKRKFNQEKFKKYFRGKFNNYNIYTNIL